MLRVYHYDFCLEFTVASRPIQGLPTTQTLLQEKGTRFLYLPGTLDKIRTYHLRQTELPKPHTTRIYFPSKEALEAFWQEYRKTFENIWAGGAVVIDGAGDILFIWRRGRWDLPKGKVEPHETPSEAAQRELVEETGLTCATPMRPLTQTFHTYMEGEKVFLKEVHWFLFRCVEKAPVAHVQKEEGIESYRWVSPKEVPFLYPQTYGTIQDVIEYVLREVLSPLSG
jgi:8-oxo-dGTP pyrophosphatase MutT (NUDIX family)